MTKIKRIFTIFLSLSIILGNGILAYATEVEDVGEISIDKTTVTVTLEPTKSDLPESSDIGVNVYFTLNKTLTEAEISTNKTAADFTGTTGLGGITLMTLFDNSDITIDDTTEGKTDFMAGGFTTAGTFSNGFDNEGGSASSYTISWINGGNNVSINLGEKQFLGTLNFKAVKTSEEKAQFTITLSNIASEKTEFMDGADGNKIATVDASLGDVQLDWDVTDSADPGDNQGGSGNTGSGEDTNTPDTDTTPTPETPAAEHEHNYVEKIVAPTKVALGGTMHFCTDPECMDLYWDAFTRDETYAQTIMPNGETVYHYCTHNGLAATTTVDIGNGQTLNVFLQDPLSTLITNPEQVLGIYVNYIPEGSARYNELMANYDNKNEIEHVIFFEVYPTVDGRPVTGQLDKSVYMEYQLPDGWDANDFKIMYVNGAADEEQSVEALTIDGKTYFATWKKHFSPYAIVDKLTDKEKAALQAQTGINIDNLSDEEKAQLDAALVEANKQAQETQTSNSSSNSVKTGDESGFITIAAITAAVIAGLYIETILKKKKSY